MTIRVGARLWAEMALFTAVLASSGCSSGPADSSAAGPGTAAPGSRPILAEMGHPDLALVVTGQLDGYLEPCGCAKGNAGGLSRRYELIERLRRQGWPVALVDLGGTIDEPTIARAGVAQARIKFQYVLKALGLLKYDALALSAADLRLGVEPVMAMYRDDLGEATRVVVANAKPAAAFQARVRPSVVVTAGQVKLGITSVIDPAAIAKLIDPDKQELLPAFEPPGQALPRVLSELESQSDYQVLMVDGPYELATQLAQANPGFDVVVALSDSLGPRSRHPGIFNDGKTTLVNVGRRGMYAGVFAFHRDQPGQRPTYRLIVLNNLYDGPGTPMKTVIEDEYRAALKAARVVETYPKQPAPGPPGSVYAGAEACAKCHASTYKKWTTTKHAQAFASLLHDPKPNTAFDAECVACHTTGFKYVSGWRSEAATPNLAGNQCENCHGPGSKHAADPGTAAFRQPMTVPTDQARKALCNGCHDHDNSPDFDFTRYWAQISHKGMD